MPTPLTDGSRVVGQRGHSDNTTTTTTTGAIVKLLMAEVLTEEAGGGGMVLTRYRGRRLLRITVEKHSRCVARYGTPAYAILVGQVTSRRYDRWPNCTGRSH